MPGQLHQLQHLLAQATNFLDTYSGVGLEPAFKQPPEDTVSVWYLYLRADWVDPGKLLFVHHLLGQRSQGVEELACLSALRVG